jgi:predicted transcriptional regulator
MRKSKLELYEEILSALADRQLSVDNLAIQCNIDCATTTDLVDFLEKNQLVENNHDYAKKRYSLTKKGQEVYKTLAKTKRINEMQKSLANIKEEKFALPSLAELKEHAHTPSLAELKELVRTRLLARSRSSH